MINHSPLSAQRLVPRIASIAGATGLLVFGSLSILGGLLAATEYLRYQDGEGVLTIVVPMFMVGSLTLLAARGQRGLGDRAGYLVFLALMIQLLTISTLGMYLGPPVIILQFAIIISLAVRFRSSAGFKILLMGFALAGVSAFIYQRTGPAIGVYGNLCGEPPNHLCYGPVLGAGFPLQYVVDSPTISVPGMLGLEDDLRGPSMVIDVLVYCLAIFGGYRFIQIIRFRKSESPSRSQSSNQRATRDN
ncbi:MAG: hypothetical protein AMJ88_00935 [Anaerolineae bacterium SM23_ 63]|nr:MAG: hypothetical protein AMJ88_00935 [Anaerolineae bacterium SM23_ 63]HEY47926.1 hypothetical protein [Anaerolineae bacterium]